MYLIHILIPHTDTTRPGTNSQLSAIFDLQQMPVELKLEWMAKDKLNKDQTVIKQTSAALWVK